MVTGSVRQAASHLAKAFRDHLQSSPVHLPGSAQFRPSTHFIFSTFANADPAPKRQGAITPKLLRAMHTLAGLEFRETHDSPAAAAADLAILGFFAICHALVRECHHYSTRLDQDSGCARRCFSGQGSQRNTTGSPRHFTRCLGHLAICRPEKR
jgi:hypothetical protein